MTSQLINSLLVWSKSGKDLKEIKQENLHQYAPVKRSTLFMTIAGSEDLFVSLA